MLFTNNSITFIDIRTGEIVDTLSDITPCISFYSLVFMDVDAINDIKIHPTCKYMAIVSTNEHHIGIYKLPEVIDNDDF